VVFGPRGGFAILGAGALSIAIVFGLNATNLAKLNTPETVLKKVNELDSEIAGLKSKLDARIRALP